MLTYIYIRWIENEFRTIFHYKFVPLIDNNNINYDKSLVIR